MSTLFSLDNRIALLTGGFAGYGWMIAEGLVEQGVARVYLAAKEPFTPRTILDEDDQIKLDNIYKNIIHIQCDITTEEGREKLFCEINALEASLNILINSSLYNAEDWDEVIKYNLEAPIKIT